MKKKTRFTSLQCALLSLALATPVYAESTEKDASSKPTSSSQFQATTLVKVNGQIITDLDVMAFNVLRGTNASQLKTNEDRIALLNQIINISLLAQQAKKEGLEQRPEVQATIKMADIQVLAEAAVNHFLNNTSVSDDEIKAVYDATFTPESLREYKVSHILVSDENEAKTVIEALEKGEKFADLAKAHSIDGSKDMGGELGWLGKNQVVEPFGTAMSQLEKGQYTKTPIKTQFGWHVILLEDTREQTPPPLEQLKEQIKAKIREQKLTEYVSQLRTQASIELPQADSDAPTQAKTPATSPSQAKPETAQ